MRVLWVCNIMLPVIAERLHRMASNKEGWLSGLFHLILEGQKENQIELGVAFPIEKELEGYRESIDLREGGKCICYGFFEDMRHAEIYDEKLEARFREIYEDFAPDIVHCFGTEYGHTLAAVRSWDRPQRMLIGIQGLCEIYAKAYPSDLPEKVWKSVTLRDILRRDDLKQQQEKFFMRGRRETEAVQKAGNITGRTAWDRFYTEKWNPDARYYRMNETLRPEFYEGEWKASGCKPHTIFISQGDYPIKGLHYMLSALPGIRERYPDVKVYVAGDNITRAGTWKERLKLSAYGKYLRALIKENALEEQVEFLGRLNAARMKEAYLQANLFVCCSSIENSPNSLGEAMVLGMPCVSADVGGIPSLFTDGADGILYRGHDSEDGFGGRDCAGPSFAGEDPLPVISASLRDAVLEIFGDGRKAAEYGRNARRHGLKTHDGKQNYLRLLEIYGEIGVK